ncbi:E3 ubiquitin-protein ligase APD2-like isoform X2 [Macadamia integrifolia]|uniref:E3 ubiquitin-protein ligase APD2-like isoform X2 n=1 Tax=Macadamia integrifolia TaxID=60698 RepID=UPI001C4E5391|nr:E3 ubiquitin-protein ligase APD2-like isoform X2 [Macadamia integrifolia]
MEEQDLALPLSSSPSSPSVHVNGEPSGSAPSSSLSSESVLEEENHNDQELSPELHQQQQQQQQQQQTGFSYRMNISISDVASSELRDDAWSCLVVLVTFWFFSSMTLILGFYGSVNLQLSPNYSRLVKVSSIFVQNIRVEEVTDPIPGPILYGFYKTPPLDVETSWSQTHNLSIPSDFHKEWIYFLNEGSEITISYSVKSQSSSPLSLVIAKGKESLVEWTEDPSYPNTTLSWNIIHGNGVIQQKIFTSSDYYVAIGNLNSEEVEVQLDLRIQAVLYNTTDAYYKCSVFRGLCSLKLFFLGTTVAVLSSPSPGQGIDDENWYIKLSYGPRWITYIAGSGGMTVLILLAYKIFNKFQSTTGDRREFEAGDPGSERAPLLSQKDDDLSSWGSSYDSASHDEEDLEQRLAASSLDTKSLKDGENNNPRCLCAICSDAPRDCFFLPCGHCGACFTCGTRIAEEAGTCPLCDRKMKKVRKIFTV